MKTSPTAIAYVVVLTTISIYLAYRWVKEVIAGKAKVKFGDIIYWVLLFAIMAGVKSCLAR